MSHVTCHMSPVNFKKNEEKKTWLSLLVEGLLSTGPTLSCFTRNVGMYDVFISVLNPSIKQHKTGQTLKCHLRADLLNVQNVTPQCRTSKTGLWLGHPRRPTTAISGLSPPQPPIYETIDDTYELGSDYEVIPPPPAPMRTFLPSLVHVRAEGCWGDRHRQQRYCNSLDREGLRNSHRYSPHSFRGPPDLLHVL